MGDALYVEQRVEWQFAFDIHCNSFFILFLFLYVLQVMRVVFYFVLFTVVGGTES